MRLIVLDHSTMEAPILDLEDFVSANADDTELVAQVRALKPTEGFTCGGGAAPAFSVTRLA